MNNLPLIIVFAAYAVLLLGGLIGLNMLPASSGSVFFMVYAIGSLVLTLFVTWCFYNLLDLEPNERIVDLMRRKRVINKVNRETLSILKNALYEIKFPEKLCSRCAKYPPSERRWIIFRDFRTLIYQALGKNYNRNYVEAPVCGRCYTELEKSRIIQWIVGILTAGIFSILGIIIGQINSAEKLWLWALGFGLVGIILNLVIVNSYVKSWTKSDFAEVLMRFPFILFSEQKYQKLFANENSVLKNVIDKKIEQLTAPVLDG